MTTEGQNLFTATQSKAFNRKGRDGSAKVAERVFMVSTLLKNERSKLSHLKKRVNPLTTKDTKVHEGIPELSRDLRALRSSKQLIVVVTPALALEY